MQLDINQKWVSDEHPHEMFKIYDVIVQEWDNHPTETHYCWERTDLDEFNAFVASKKNMTLDEFYQSKASTYPYAWAGESQRSAIRSKIKKFNMRLV